MSVIGECYISLTLKRSGAQGHFWTRGCKPNQYDFQTEACNHRQIFSPETVREEHSCFEIRVQKQVMLNWDGNI